MYKKEKLTNDVDAQFMDMAVAAFEVDYTGGSNELSVFSVEDDNSKMISSLQFLLF